MGEQKCANCRFFYRDDPHDHENGECRRHPPTIQFEYANEYHGGGVLTKGYWPDVTVRDWCGEYSPLHVCPHHNLPFDPLASYCPHCGKTEHPDLSKPEPGNNSGNNLDPKTHK